MTTPSTTTLDTELSAVNSILGSIGQAPITSLTTTVGTDLEFVNPEIAFIYNLLTEVNMDVQNEGWEFNTELHVKLSPDTNKHIVVPPNVLRYDIHDNQNDRRLNVVTRNGRLYNKVEHTDEFESDVELDVVTLYAFEDLPPVFRRYVIYRAAGRAATQLVANPQLVQLLGTQEAQARAACLEYECEQGDHNFMGWPDGTTYRAYQPHHALRRS
tara:strand:+ start:532 stop:1173 length:642 start_codon:yes stop_codon:yes gene_type:complete